MGETSGVATMEREDEPLLKNAKVTQVEGNTFDDALDSPGVGLFHVLLVLVAGWAVASDSVEVQCISFVTPQLNNTQANPDLKLQANDFQKGLLDAMVFLGMMVGGYFWGSWSDMVGRRSCLVTSLIFNGMFGFASALSPHYYAFLVFRFMSGVGVGGSIPVAFSYFCEFFSSRRRGPFVIVLAGFWILGSVFASLLALAIITPLQHSIHLRMGLITITAWRVYIILCTIPALSAAVLLLLLPESPSFLFTKGKLKKTLHTLEVIKKVNSWSCYFYFPSKSKHLDMEFLQGISTTHEKKQSVMQKLISMKDTTIQLFSLSYLRPTAILCIVWFTFSFGYYGLFLWFPEYFKYIEDKEKGVTNVTSASSNVSSNDIYIDSVYTSLSAVPATVLGIITVNMLGGKIMLVTSIGLCAVSAFLIRVVPARERNIVILSSLFNGIATFGWNALDIITTSEIFPVHLRSTSIGIQAAVGRVGAILGNVAFGKLISLDPMIPILLVAVLLFVGGVSAIFLPSPPGESVLQNLKNTHRRCRMCLCWPFRKMLQIQQKR